MEDSRKKEIIQAILCLVQQIDSNSSSSSSDEDIAMDCLTAAGIRVRSPRLGFADTVVPQLDDREFKTYFRMSRQTFEFVLSLIEPKLACYDPVRDPIAPRTQFLMCLWRMATVDTYTSISNKFCISRPSTHACTKRVVKLLVELAPTYINWPSGDYISEIRAGFEVISGFPKVLGAVGGTDIDIIAPRIDPRSCANFKGPLSVHLQAVVDHVGLFTHCTVQHIGSVEEQQAFCQSQLREILDDPLKFPEGCHLVGDSGYELHGNLLVPYQDELLTVRQRNYNSCVTAARMCVDRAFRLLKGRFRSLLAILPMPRAEAVADFIVACCVLHNICLTRGDRLDGVLDDVPQETEQQNELVTCADKRDAMCDQLPMRQ